MLGGSHSFDFKAGSAAADIPNITGKAGASITCKNTIASGATGELSVY